MSSQVGRARLFVRDIEPDPGYEVLVFDPGEEVAVEPSTWEEFVPLAEFHEAEREWCRLILDVDKRDAGDGRLLATLANMAATRLDELGGLDG